MMITPSFAPDFQRCKLLVESVRDFVTSIEDHVLLVDRRDVPLFRELAGPKTRLIEVESILPRWVMRLPGARRWWLSLKTWPIRNWILQQVVKLGVAEHLDADVYMFVDSDVTMIRPFDASEMIQPDGNVRLFRVPGAAQFESHARWHRTAAKLLGLPSTDYFGSNYIGNLITWRRDHLLSLYERIQQVTSRPWAEAVCSSLHLSEYILYGVFVEHLLNGRGHFYTDHAHCHISWDYDISTPKGLQHFFDETRPDHVAVMVSSKAGLPVSAYQDHLKAFHNQLQSV
jgi:hypothetical protein